MANGVHARGIVKWYNTEKAYGFIKPAEGGPDVFVHKKHLTASGIKRDLIDGENVLFSARKGDKGMQVESLMLTEDNPQ